VNFSTQVHDLEPGINPYPDGLFWTVPIPASAVSVHFGAGRARYTMTDMEMEDYFDIINALFQFYDPVSVPAVTSFDVRLGGPISERTHVHDAAAGYEGTFLLNQASMSWSASTEDGWSFVSDPETSSAFSMMAKERNGVFFGG
jgi:hypothetical protein